MRRQTLQEQCLIELLSVSNSVEQELLTEANRVTLIAQSRNAGAYKNTERGKNRFERKKYSKIANAVKNYNEINMNALFKQDILQVNIPVVGENDEYTVTVKLEGVINEIQKNIKNNSNKLEFRTIIQALTKVFNTTDVYVKCTCPDFKYRFAHWNIVKNVSVDDSANDPGPGKGIANPNDDKGRGCKHILLVLANGDWMMKVASVINNYCHFLSEKKPEAFLKLVFPKLYGVPADEADQNDIVENNEDLETGKDLIDVINDWAKNRGKFKKGSNINPVYADKLSKEQSKDTDEKAETNDKSANDKKATESESTDKSEKDQN
jgi:hypothetical protein